MIWFRCAVLLPPIANHTLIPTAKGGKVRMVQAPEHRRWMEGARQVYAKMEAVRLPPGVPAKLTIQFYRPTTKAGKIRADSDNGLKLVKDSLTGWTWEDDNVVWCDHVERLPAEPGTPGFALITVEVEDADSKTSGD